MREALELVKQELGEEALVLDSKRVRAGGLLGLGAQELVEVRVASEPSVKSEPTRKSPRGSSRNSILNLNAGDDDLRLQTPAPKDERANASTAFTALAARSYAAHDLPDETRETKKQVTSAPPPVANSVEIADTAPRIVHRSRPLPAASSVETSDMQSETQTEQDSPAAPRNRLSNELDQLRAELREVKFALSTLSVRPVFETNSASHPDSSTESGDEIYDSPFYESYLELANCGLAPELARRAVRETIKTPAVQTLNSNEIARAALINLLATQLRFVENPLTTQAGAANNPSTVALIGPTGVGKTTTIAKLAARLALHERRRVELITIDTYRIAAVEQLKTYAEIIGANCHVARSVLEMDALIRRFEGEATVLIDTTGRNPHDLADQLELADYLRSHQTIAKCLVLQATINAEDAAITAKKFALYGADHLAITKLDETIRPGSAVNLAAGLSLPLLYLCAGQRVPEDFESASAEAFAARVLRPKAIAAAAAAA